MWLGSQHINNRYVFLHFLCLPLYSLHLSLPHISSAVLAPPSQMPIFSVIWFAPLQLSPQVIRCDFRWDACLIFTSFYSCAIFETSYKVSAQTRDGSSFRKSARQCEKKAPTVRESEFSIRVDVLLWNIFILPLSSCFHCPHSSSKGFPPSLTMVAAIRPK